LPSKVADSDGRTESYTYDDKLQMQTVKQGSSIAAIVNEYDISGKSSAQTMPVAKKFPVSLHFYPRGRGNAAVLIELQILAPSSRTIQYPMQAG